MSKIVLNSCTVQELKDIVLSVGEKPFRAKQLYNWLHSVRVSSFDEMKNVPKSMIASLSEISYISRIDELSRVVSKRDGSMKVLLALDDGERVEAVLLKDKDRVTACISTQVGCKMGCKFCSTAQIGYKRDLSAAEIVDQIRTLEEITYAEGYTEEGRLTSIVVMGMGEPLDNLENLAKALNILMDEEGYGYSHKRITVSTAGLASKIQPLYSKLIYPVNLAVSLNASNQFIRNEIMPVSSKFPLDMLVKTVEKLLPAKHDITFEYVLIDELNAGEDEAYELLSIVKRLPVKINLIRYNGGGIEGLYPPSMDTVFAFQKVLTDNGVKAFIRKSLGADIWGACGQLAAGYETKK